MPLYTGINGARKEITELYCGISGAKRNISDVYAGQSGVRKLVFTSKSKNRVVITGNGNVEHYGAIAYVQIGDEQYATAQTIDVEAGTEVYVFAWSGDPGPYGGVFFNGQPVGINYEVNVEGTCNVELSYTKVDKQDPESWYGTAKITM